MSLILEVYPGDALIINDASIRFRNRATVELTAHARFLVGKQIMPPGQATSPARRIYFAMQTAYIGNEEERVEGLSRARELVAAFKSATTSALARSILDRALDFAATGEGHQALKLARRIMQHEDDVLGVAVGLADERTHAAAGAERPTTH